MPVDADSVTLNAAESVVVLTNAASTTNDAGTVQGVETFAVEAVTTVTDDGTVTDTDEAVFATFVTRTDSGTILAVDALTAFATGTYEDETTLTSDESLGASRSGAYDDELTVTTDEALAIASERVFDDAGTVTSDEASSILTDEVEAFNDVVIVYGVETLDLAPCAPQLVWTDATVSAPGSLIQPFGRSISRQRSARTQQPRAGVVEGLRQLAALCEEAGRR